MGARYWAPWSCARDLHMHTQTLSPIFTNPLHIGFMVVQIKKQGSGESSGQGPKSPAKEEISQGSELGPIRRWSPCLAPVPFPPCFPRLVSTVPISFYSRAQWHVPISSWLVANSFKEEPCVLFSSSAGCYVSLFYFFPAPLEWGLRRSKDGVCVTHHSSSST